ncbi:exopolysaccharide biosynthesis polyprenyl glycosylphosphotransferase [Streptomyces sp. JJ36]|uniref:exopolysaccharide biosynthesis polyprenyl glycosylphosphotransferase n=1 Tax=Streptomyces sp. JJ36 TaxID=2736645 RepID=UPI001F01C771|nr:exopolysaccharide biosynthesis polyprenyl glycosylphosphotransferase [Streptomyces sp. JJ36]MCF6525456.1 exopolysaccharide biosynthesis polyprenyl glycosylphosphotransferase [Streptomyces sp. JJ36]
MTVESTGTAPEAPPREPGRPEDLTDTPEPGSRRPGRDRSGGHGRATSSTTAAVPAPRSRPHRTGTPPRDRGQAVCLVAADCLAATTALATVRPRAALLGLVPALVVLVALHQQGGLYRRGPWSTACDELPGLLWRAALAWGAATTVVVVVRPELTVGWTRLLCLVAVHVVLVVLLRGAVYGRQRRRRRRNPRSTLVVGTPAVARRIAAVLHEHPEYGIRPVGLVVPHAAPEEAAGPGAAPPGQGDAAGLPVPVLTAAEDVTRAVVQNSVCDAVFTRRALGDPETTELMALFRGLGCAVWVIDGETAPGGLAWHAEEAGHVWGFPCVRLRPPTRRVCAHAAKRAVDVTVAALALLAAAPLLALCALAVRLADGPGVLFRQERVGVHGRPFVMLKFRSLRPTGHHESATRWNVAGDMRMSAVGRFLRRTSLDELPQLWNVLRGDMSLVGPRPERPYFVQQFSTAHPGYAARHRMPVGITGLAQVSGLRGDTSIEDRARFDNHYIETWSLWQDVRILARTAGAVFRLAGS